MYFIYISYSFVRKLICIWQKLFQVSFQHLPVFCVLRVRPSLRPRARVCVCVCWFDHPTSTGYNNCYTARYYVTLNFLGHLIYSFLSFLLRTYLFLVCCLFSHFFFLLLFISFVVSIFVLSYNSHEFKHDYMNYLDQLTKGTVIQYTYVSSTRLYEAFSHVSKNEPERYQSSRENGGVYTILDASHIDIYIYLFLCSIKFFHHSRSHFKILDSGRVTKKHVPHWGHTNIKSHVIKFGRSVGFGAGIFAPTCISCVIF
jgi:hypothetical protein